ncbi:hypothetical protein [Puniceibacterium sp. IMCC21224]|uniref:hypothetical protein n=1 Tax=Puniceibacterium sp. IMCC21224 TaxID=1618204 RepID=UPI00065D0D32|nr:hypothetical protein [Puniceibacterium sp. IMCC21224]KMK66842.1 hypothetical protein IMCC21224_111699 [Puniceibacterium sp. IMCC21224]
MTPADGATNMLLNCADARIGERLLIAYESAEHGYYGADAVPCVVAAADALGLDVMTMDVGFSPHSPQLTPELLEGIGRSDIVVFLARLGDQLRFAEMPAGKRVVVSFALDGDHFGSAFATTHHKAMVALKTQVTAALEQARDVRVTCALGSDFAGMPNMGSGAGGDTSVRRFPMSVFQPVPAHGFSGKVALCGFLTGTGSLYYDNYTLEFDGPVLAVMRNGQLVGFEGGASDVAAANAHYDRVSSMFGIARNHVHSWHAGIHPGCGYLQNARDNFERWGGASFGNPRILHLHTCGTYAPGEISWNMLDPTIEIDGVPVWEGGAFHPERVPGGQAVLDRFRCAASVFSRPERRIGFCN